MENIDEISPEFEPLSSVLDNDNSNDESVSGMSDLASVGSPVQLISKENHDTNSNGFESNKNPIEKLQPMLPDVNGINNHKNENAIVKPEDVSKISNNSEKLKTSDSKSSKSKHSSKTNVPINTQEKSNSHRSKDHNSSNHRSSSREKSDIKKRNSSSSKDRKSSNHSKHHSTSKDKKHKHDKKSHHNDRDKSPKRDRKDSRSDKKEKSSSLCKEPKSLNGNRSDDDSNAGGSSKQKSSLHKNKSSTSDKSKSSSSNHKSSKKDNSSKEVVDKSKDKSSISKNANTSNQKSDEKDTKKHKRSLGEKYKLETNDSNVEEKKPKWNDLRSSITNDEQDAANILLSISEIPYESSHNDVKTENAVLPLGNSSPTNETQKMLLNTTEKKLEISENSKQTKIIQSSNNDNVKENVNLKTDGTETSQQVNSFDGLSEKNISKLNHSIENSCNVDVERHPLSCKDVKLQNVDIISEHNQPSKEIKCNKDQKLLNGIVNFDSSEIQMASEHDGNDSLKVPKLKLKRLQNQNDSIKERVKVKKHHKINDSKIKKFKSLKSYVLSNENCVPVIETASTTVICNSVGEQESNLVTDIKMNEPSHELLHNENENKNTSVIDDEECTFKGFSQTDSVYCKNYRQLKDLIKTLQEEINRQNKIENDGFKGFSCADVRPCDKRHVVHSQLIKLKENLGFKGFSEKEAELRTAHKFVKEQLELAKKQNNNQEKPVSSGGNGIQNGKKLNEVMAILYKSDEDKTASGEMKQVYDQASENNKKDCPAVNNNNHDITASDDWVVEQEMKYNLLPVKVKIERLSYRCNSKYILLNVILLFYKSFIYITPINFSCFLFF